MGIYSKVTEQALINLRKLAEQQHNQRVVEIHSRILKQTHDIKKQKAYHINAKIYQK